MKKIGIGIIGLGNIGSRFYKEIISNKREIGLKTGTNINIVGVSAKNINKKRNFKVRNIGIPPHTEASNSKLTLFFSARTDR